MNERLSDEHLRWLRDAAAIDGLPRPNHDRLKQQHAKGMRDVADALDELLTLRAGAIERGGQDIGKLREKIAALVDQAVDDLLKEQSTWFEINSRTTDRILALLRPAAPSEAADVIAARLRAAFARNKDFCDGVATRIIADLTAAGYRIVPSAPPSSVHHDTVEVGVEAASEYVSSLPNGQKSWGNKEYRIAETAARAALAANLTQSMPPPVDTVRVRIAVAVDPKGFVSSRAIGDMHDEGLARMVLNDVGRGARISFITADVPKPQPPAEITGRVE